MEYFADMALCGWSVVQSDHDGEREPVHGYFGPIEAAIWLELW